MVYEKLPRTIKHTYITTNAPATSPYLDKRLILVTKHVQVSLLAVCHQVHEEARDILSQAATKFVQAPLIIGHVAWKVPTEEILVTVSRLAKVLAVIPCSANYRYIITNTVSSPRLLETTYLNVSRRRLRELRTMYTRLHDASRCLVQRLLATSI